MKRALRPVFFLFFLILSSIQLSSAAAIKHLGYDEFLSNSQTAPSLSIAIFGSPSSKATSALIEKLKSKENFKIVERSGWNYFNINEIIESKKQQQRKFFEQVKFSDLDSKFNLIIFKLGVPVGLIEGVNVAQDEEQWNLFLKFLQSLENANFNLDSLQSKSVPACLQNQDPVAVVGISGNGSDFGVFRGDEVFGLENLQNFSRIFPLHKSLNLTGPLENFAYDMIPFFEKADFYYVMQPRHLNRFQGVERYSSFFRSGWMKHAFRKDVKKIKLMMTGHGSLEGVEYFVEDKKGNPRNDILSPNHLKQFIQHQESEKKSVQGVFLQCHSGIFAESFMPKQPDQQVQSCGVFSSIPQLVSEGCYRFGRQDTEIEDFWKSLMRTYQARCDKKQDPLNFRRHYYQTQAWNTLRSIDLPLLTSDYFLIHGPAGQFLAQQSGGSSKRIPFIENAITVFSPKPELLLYFDRSQEKMLKAYRGSEEIQLPKMVRGQKCSIIEDLALEDHLEFLFTRVPHYDEKALCRYSYDLIWEQYPELNVKNFLFNPSLEQSAKLTEKQSEIWHELAEKIEDHAIKTEAQLFYKYIYPQIKQMVMAQIPYMEVQGRRSKTVLFPGEPPPYLNPQYVFTHALRRFAIDFAKTDPELAQALHVMVKNTPHVLGDENQNFDIVDPEMIEASIFALMTPMANHSLSRMKLENYYYLKLAHLLRIALLEKTLFEMANSNPRSEAKKHWDQYLSFKKCEEQIF